MPSRFVSTYLDLPPVVTDVIETVDDIVAGVPSSHLVLASLFLVVRKLMLFVEVLFETMIGEEYYVPKILSEQMRRESSVGAVVVRFPVTTMSVAVAAVVSS